MAKIIDVEGIGAVYAQKLVSVGITTTNKLLKKRGNTPGSC
jgi:predicted flap endonuclease-1-like 5' DNA nuclease